MLTAGDEFGRSQRGNNNAYCQDSPLTWLNWDHEPWQQDAPAHVARLTRLRAENPALRPLKYARLGEHIPNASVMDWFDQGGHTMDVEQWNDPRNRTLQYVAASTPDTEEFNRILLMVHGIETPVDVPLPTIEGVSRYVSLWSSAEERPGDVETVHAPGEVVSLPGTSMRLFRAE